MEVKERFINMKFVKKGSFLEPVFKFVQSHTAIDY